MADETSCLVRLNRPKILVRHTIEFGQNRARQKGTNVIIPGIVDIVSKPHIHVSHRPSTFSRRLTSGVFRVWDALMLQEQTYPCKPLYCRVQKSHL